jgi:antagonist of KipI
MDSIITLSIIRPGLNSMVQDAGRSGYQKFGVPVNGFMDRSSARIANWLVGNPLNDPLLEITMLGPQIEIDNSCSIAVTGADISPMLNGELIPMYETHRVDSNSTLSFGKLNSGCRTYISFSGKLDVKQWLGSASASAHETQNLTPQSLLTKNMNIRLISSGSLIERRFPWKSKFESKIVARILPGPEYNYFSGETLSHFLNHEFVVGINSNRMGYRLEGTVRGFNPDKEVISSAVIPGTIQITNSGSPIILMADAQTSGGYPRLANIISADLDKVAQLKPGDTIAFQLTTLEKALEAKKVYEHYLNQLK